jgi:hypothetical protein
MTPWSCRVPVERRVCSVVSDLEMWHQLLVRGQRTSSNHTQSEHAWCHEFGTLIPVGGMGDEDRGSATGG